MSEQDDELTRALGRALDRVPVADSDLALAAVTARAGVVRRRRTAVRAGAALVAAGVIGSLWLVAQPTESTQVDIVDAPTTPSPVVTNVVDSTPVTSAPTTTAVVPSTSSVPSTTTVGPAPSSGPAPAAPPAPTTAPVSVSGPTTVVPPASGPTTYSGIGGQVTVRVDGGALVLLAVQPTPGYTVAEQKVQPSEIEVRFENASVLDAHPAPAQGRCRRGRGAGVGVSPSGWDRPARPRSG